MNLPPPSSSAHAHAREHRTRQLTVAVLDGAPRPPRSCLNSGTRSPTTSPEMEALRRRVWREQGVASLAIDDITDPWLRQAVINEATRRWGPRNGGQYHGR